MIRGVVAGAAFSASRGTQLPAAQLLDDARAGLTDDDAHPLTEDLPSTYPVSTARYARDDEGVILTDDAGNLLLADDFDTAPGYPLPLIENFDTIAGNLPTGGLVWHNDSYNEYTLTGGGGSAVMAATTADGGAFFIGNQHGLSGQSGVDLTGYDTISLDVAVTVNTAGTLYLAAAGDLDFGGNFSFSDGNTPGGQTGSFTISADISNIADKTHMVIEIGMYSDAGMIATISNLRAS